MENKQLTLLKRIRKFRCLLTSCLGPWLTVCRSAENESDNISDEALNAVVSKETMISLSVEPVVDYNIFSWDEYML